MITVGFAVISGITYLAVRHPKLFNEVIIGKIYLVLVIAFLTIASWAVAVAATMSVLAPYIPSEKLPAAKAEAERLGLPFLWIIGGFFALNLYLGILLWLSFHLQREQRQSN